MLATRRCNSIAPWDLGIKGNFFDFVNDSQYDKNGNIISEDNYYREYEGLNQLIRIRQAFIYYSEHQPLRLDLRPSRTPLT